MSERPDEDPMYPMNIGSVETADIHGEWCVITITKASWAAGLWRDVIGYGLNVRDPSLTVKRNPEPLIIKTVDVADRAIAVRGPGTKDIQPGDVLRPAWSDT